MMNTPMLFCGLCLAPNTDGLDECANCGTSTMMRPYVVRFTIEVQVNEFTELQAIERALAMANGDLVTYIVGMETGEQDLDNEHNED